MGDVRHHFARIEGLGYKIIGLQFQPGDLVGVFDAGSEHDDRCSGQEFIISHNVRDFPTISLLQHQVQDNQVRLLATDGVQDGFAIVRHNDMVARLFQVGAQQPHDLSVIFYN